MIIKNLSHLHSHLHTLSYSIANRICMYYITRKKENNLWLDTIYDILNHDHSVNIVCKGDQNLSYVSIVSFLVAMKNSNAWHFLTLDFKPAMFGLELPNLHLYKKFLAMINKKFINEFSVRNPNIIFSLLKVKLLS